MMIRTWLIPACLAGVLLSGGERAAAQTAPAGLDVTNRVFERLWRRDGVPLVRASLDREVQALVGTTHGSQRANVEVNGMRSTLQIDPALGFPRLDDQVLQLRVPLRGTWRLVVEADVTVRVRWGFFRMTKHVTIKAEVKDLSALVHIDVDSSDPVRPKVVRVQRPQLDFKVKLSTNKWYLNAVLFFLKGKLNRLARKAVDDAIAALDPTLASLAGLPNTGFGQGGPGIAQQAPGLPLDQAALRIHRDIVRYHLPYGSLTSTHFDRAYMGTWEDSLRDPSFNPGNQVRHGGYGDSAIWTGHYLAAVAFRYGVTNDPAALAEARTVVESFNTMLKLRGVPGLLNRALQPVVQSGAQGDYVNTYQGVDYACYDFISRDQYMGFFFGIAAAHELIPDPTLRSRAQAAVELALDYILANGWTARRRNGEVSTTWATSHFQQLAWLHVGNRANPAKYGQALADHAGLADLAWMGPWVTTLDPVSKYYKFNLSHGTFHTLLRLETDPGRFFKELRGMRILRAAVGHHQNAHFDMCYVSSDPALAPVLRDDVRNLLALWLKRPRRYLSFDHNNDPTIDKVTFTGTSSAAVGLPHTSGTVAKFPLPLDKRHCTDFTWQRSPFQLTSHGTGHEGEPGADFILPYWMARYYRVLP